MFRKFVFAALLASSVPALAQSGAVTLQSDAKVERVITDGNGQTSVTLAEPTTVVPGDTVVFTIHYRNTSDRDVSDFVINNPIPAAIRFERSDNQQAVVSVEGGRTIGRLDTLTVGTVDGTARPATANDVTHVRWTFPQPIAARQSGAVSFRGNVR